LAYGGGDAVGKDGQKLMDVVEGQSLDCFVVVVICMIVVV